MTLDSPLTAVKGVGPELAKKLAKLELHSVGELLDYLPRKYEDYSQVEPISRLHPGIVTIQATIKQVTGRYVRRGLHITEAVASDETGSVRIIWFNQPYRAEAIKKSTDYFVSGLFELRNQRLVITNPSMELVSDFPISTARIVPIYHEIKGLKSNQIRKLIREVTQLVDTLPETLPAWLISEQQLLSRPAAVRAMHFPASAEQLAEAKRRLGFEEVFGLSLASLLNKYELLHEAALQIPFDEKLAKSFVKHLPFQLTDAQRRIVWQIYLDIQKKHPMNRLVEGDVGSGKTVVATMGALMPMRQGFQVAYLAPTELLARQHADTIHSLLEPLGYANEVGLLVGSLTPAQKRQAHARLKTGDLKFIVGTHALLQEKVDMQRLGLVIIDEQHRFGVEQRTKLQQKAGHMPHVLSMTATPIPRSLALTLYGELDVSILDVKPMGRLPIITKIVSPNSRTPLYRQLETELEAGRQVFIVCPTITDDSRTNTVSVEQMYERLSKHEFKHRRVGLLHGRLKADAKTKTMEQFVNHQLDILVATTVIEVGVDVPNATVMVIEAADRFGLAQIHQLRGRVGRSQHQGYCYLVTSDSKAPSRRLRAVESSGDGFQLAELDLEIRGPGAIYGTLQHGQLDLRVAKLTDIKLIAQARTAAQAFIDRGEGLLQYKHLAERVEKLRAVTNLN